MDKNIGIKERLELALRPAEPPTLEEALEEVSRRGVLRGPVDWVFPAWMLYVEYATQKIAETFPLSEEEKRQLFHFRDTLKQLLLKAWVQAKEKLTTLYKAVVEGTYRVEGKRLYAPDGTWMYVRGVPYIIIHGVTAKTRFPDLLKLPRERLELLQLGWRASDEGNEKGWPYMGTVQPWQVFVWAATRYGEFYIRIDSANLTHMGLSISVHLRANSWRQKWNKDEAIDLVTSHLKRGEWAPLLTMWLGDGEARRREVLHGKYRLVITAKEPWRLGISVGTRKALVARGKEAFVKLKEVADAYGVLFDILKAHKWVVVKLATDDGFRTAYKLKAKRRSIDEITEQFSRPNKPGTIAVANVIMFLYLHNNSGGSLFARRYICDLGKALSIANKLKAAGLRPNVVRSGLRYMVYIATADLLRLAEQDETIRKAIALYLAEKAKNGTPRQREIAEKILKRHPLFSANALLLPKIQHKRPRVEENPHVAGLHIETHGPHPQRLLAEGDHLHHLNLPRKYTSAASFAASAAAGTCHSPSRTTGRV